MFGINAKANLTLPEIAVAEQEARAERKTVLDQFKKHVITTFLGRKLTVLTVG